MELNLTYFMKGLFICLLIMSAFINANAQKRSKLSNTAFYKGTIRLLPDEQLLFDSVVLVVIPRYLGVNDESVNPTTKVYKVKLKNNQFVFSHIPVDSISVASFLLTRGSKETALVKEAYCYASPGDSVDMQIILQRKKGDTSRFDNISVDFSGIGAAKFTTQNRISAKTAELINKFNSISNAGSRPVYDSMYWSKRDEVLKKHLELNESIYTASRVLLDSARSALPSREYQLLLSDCISKVNLKKLTTSVTHYREIATSFFSQDDLSQLRKRIWNLYMNEIVHDFSDVSQRDLTASIYFAQWQSTRSVFLPMIDGNNGFAMLAKQERNRLTDKILTHYVLDYYRDFKNGDSILNASTKIVKDEVWSSMLSEYADSQLAGSKGFDFKLEDIEGNPVSLTDFRGKLVFIDFWYTGCAACGSFYRNDLKPVEEHFSTNPNIVFISISADIVKENWRNSLNTQSYTSTKMKNVRNLYTDGKGKGHPVITNYKVTSYPRPIIIDPNGKIYKADRLQIRSEELIDIMSKAVKKFNLSD